MNAASSLQNGLFAVKCFCAGAARTERASATTIHERDFKMAALPSNSTDVLYVDYTTCGEPHTIQMRFNDDGSVTEAMSKVDEVLTALSPLLRLITITGARVRAMGGSVSLPVTWGGDATYGSGAGVHFETAYYADMIGRSDLGVRVRMAVFGFHAPADITNDDFRLTAAESSDVSNAIDALNASTGVAIAVDGLHATWYPYINVGTNAYWRNHIR